MTNSKEAALQRASRSVMLVFSDVPVETSRADWIAAKLEDEGIHTIMHRYGHRDDRLPFAPTVRLVVLFSERTPDWVSEQYFLFEANDHRPLPVKVEACKSPVLLAAKRFANIFGTDESHEKEFQKLVEAILS